MTVYQNFTCDVDSIGTTSTGASELLGACAFVAKRDPRSPEAGLTSRRGARNDA